MISKIVKVKRDYLPQYALVIYKGVFQDGDSNQRHRFHQGEEQNFRNKSW